MEINWLYDLIAVLLAFPVGLWIAWMAGDELIDGRIWFRVLMILSGISGVALYLFGIGYAALACLFIFILALFAYGMSFNNKWTKRRI